MTVIIEKGLTFQQHNYKNLKLSFSQVFFILISQLVLCEDLLILPPNNVSAAPDQQT
jgi:hypothetical protein